MFAFACNQLACYLIKQQVEIKKMSSVTPEVPPEKIQSLRNAFLKELETKGEDGMWW